MFNISTVTISATTANGNKLKLSSSHKRAVAYYSAFEKGVATIRVLKNRDGSVVKNEDGTVRLSFPDRYDNRVTPVKLTINSVKVAEKQDPMADDSFLV